MKRALTFTSVVYCLFLILTFSVQAQSPISYNPSDDFDNVRELAANLAVNADIEITDVSIIGQLGNNATIGSFSNGLQPLGFEDGIILSNSPIFQFAGGNTTTSAGDDLGLPGDQNLSLINQVYNGGTQTSTNDATVLVIDFLPLKSSISVTFSFASEEYCENVGSQFTDKMGIFLSGPGIQGSFNANGLSAVNIAEIPTDQGSVDYVGINNINSATNSQFYIDNNTTMTASSTTGACSISNPANNVFVNSSQFDGWTEPIEAVYNNLQIEQQYQLRIAIADGADAISGSAIFLEAGSFGAGTASTAVVADAGPSQNLTCVVNVVTLGGTSTSVNVNYEWTGPNGFFSSEPNPQVAEPGLYILTVTDPSTGETATDEVEVDLDIEITDFEIDFVTNILTCENSSVLFTVVLDDPSIDASYEWEGPNGSIISTDDELVVTEAGTYIVIVTNINNGCSSSNAEVVLEDFQTLLVSIDTPELLSNMNPTTVLSANGTSQGPNISYQWTSTSAGIVSGANTLFPTVNQAGTYCLTAVNSENGCEATSCVDVLEDFQVLTADAGPDQILNCFNGFPEPLGSATNPTGPEFSYNWTGPGMNVYPNQPFIQVSSFGTYILTITNTTTGESSTDTVELIGDTDAPIALIEGAQVLTCENNLVQLFGSTFTPDVSYLWTTVNGSILTDSTLASINIDQAGLYILTVTDDNNGCSGESTVTIPSYQTEETTINVPTINSTQPDVVLIGIDYVDEENEGPYDFVWSDQNGPFDDLPSIIVDQSGVYTLTATNIYGCVTTVILTVNFGQNLVADAGPTQDLTCVTSAVTIGSTNTSTGSNITYTWTDGSGAFFSADYQPEVTIPSQYRLTVTDTNTGETAVDAVFINEDSDIPEFQIVSPTNTLTCENPTAILSAVLDDPFLIVTYEWSGPGITGVTDDRIVASTGGSYTLTVTNPNNGCLNEMQYEVLENFENATTNIDHGTFSNFPIEIDADSYITNPSATYSWEARDGLQVDNFPVAIISKPGDYTLLEDLGSTSCVNRYVFKVIGGSTIADAGSDQTLDCVTGIVVLGSNATSEGSQYTYTWTDQIGNQVGTTPFIEVTIPGSYTLTVFNTQDNTFDSDEVLVLIDDVLVQVQIPTPDILDCENTVVTIQGFTLGGTNLEFKWTTLDGDLISATNQPNVDVAAPGTYTLEVVDPSNGCSTISSVVVEQIIDGGSFDIEPIQSSVYPITITADDFPAGLTLDFAWIPASGLIMTSATSAEITQPGQYTFVATNVETGCDYIYVYTVYDNVLADAGVSQALTCVISSVTIGGSNSTAGPNIEYNWTNPNGQTIASTPTVEVSESGVFTLMVTNVVTGESIQDQVLVTEDFQVPFFDILSPSPITIENPISIIDAALNYGPDAAISDFFWTTFNGNIVSNPKDEDVEVDKPGTYELTVTNTVNGCSAIGSTVVEQSFDSDIILLETIVVSDFPVQLDPSAIVADTTGLTHQPYPLIRSSSFDFKWVERSGLEITDFPLALAFQDGIYAFLKIDVTTGFVTRYEYNINLMSSSVIADAGLDLILDCTDFEIDFSLGGENTSEGLEFTYQWISAFGNVVSTERIFNLSESQLDGFPYTLVVTNTTTGEQASDTVDFVDDTSIPSILIDVPEILNCVNTEIIIDLSIDSLALSEVSIMWDGPGIISDPSAEDISVNQPGTYSVTVTDVNNGCETTSTVLVNQDMDGLVLSFEIIDVTCFGFNDGSIDVTAFGGTAPYTFDMPALVDLSSGEYTVSVTDANGCMAIASAIISEPPPLAVEFTINAENQIEAVVTGGVGAYTYAWNVEANANIIENPINGTEYELTVTDANGCTLTDTYIFVLDGVFSPSAKQITVSPNPTDGLIYLQLDAQSRQAISQLNIFDIQGNLMSLSNDADFTLDTTLDLSHFPAGAYILQVVMSGDLYYQKIIVF